MGYSTRYRLSILEGEDYNINYELEISELADYTNCFEEEIKWYSYEDDMLTYSEKYPNTVFEVKGEGEESGDIWKHYFKAGKSFRSRAEIIFEEYSEDKLE